jgi:hypothetical protein
MLEEVGIGLQRWAQLRGVPMEYAKALQEYLDQEKKEKQPRPFLFLPLFTKCVEGDSRKLGSLLRRVFLLFWRKYE